MQYKKALELVAELFRDIDRKVSGLPAITHLVGVSYIIGQVTNDEDVIIAGLLHDVLEDVKNDIYDEEKMINDFGEKITEIVKTVSHNDEKYGKEESRRRYLVQIENGPIEASLVSAADLIHNSTDLNYWYLRQPELIKSIFGGESAEIRSWFWGQRYEIIKNRLGSDHKLVLELEPLISQLHKVNKEIM